MSVSIFNDVIGPIMRGPSSGHTAATWRMGNITLQILGSAPKQVECRFHKYGAYANVFKQQRSDLAFAAGLMNLAMEDQSYDLAFEKVKENNIELSFSTPDLQNANHPNEVEVLAQDIDNNSIIIRLRSIGGGVVSLISINGYHTEYNGNKYGLFLLMKNNYHNKLQDLLFEYKLSEFSSIHESEKDNCALYSILSSKEFPFELINVVNTFEEILNIFSINPIMFSVWDKQDLRQEFIKKVFVNPLPANILASSIAKDYELALLGITEKEAQVYLDKCLKVMYNCVQSGLELKEYSSMKILKPLAGKLLSKNKAMLIGGVHSEVAIYSMAAAEWNGSGGLIVAAPTAGSGAIIPAVIVKLKELKITEESILHGLWAAGLIGLAIADQYTFAGGVGGCQVEIGSAGAMAAALIVEATLHHRREPSHLEHGLGIVLSAATLFLQNSLGLVCDPVQGFVELPCISRNATAASQAFVCADLALSGWKSPISFYDTILAMKDVGDKMAMELRCTSLGGLASRPLAKDTFTNHV